MKLWVKNLQLDVYLRIGIGFLGLNLFGDLLRDPTHFGSKLINELWLLIFLLPNNFLLFERTIPYIRHKWIRWLLAPFLFLFHLGVYSFGLYIWRLIGLRLQFYTDELTADYSIGDTVTAMFTHSLSSILFFGIVRHIHHYRKLSQMAQQLRIEKQEAELNYLKAQTNPHFLFNTLNNIYALAREKSDLAPESVLRLSKILRYMLYETSVDFIPLEQEIKVIEDYIALEQLRYDEALRIHFSYDVENLKQALPPLLLIPLVENAFKHGVAETRHEPFVTLYLSVNQRNLYFLVKNSTGESGVGSKVIKENIGLSNLRRQLELLYKESTLHVETGEGVFTATLTINLSSHV